MIEEIIFEDGVFNVKFRTLVGAMKYLKKFKSAKVKIQYVDGKVLHFEHNPYGGINVKLISK